MALGIERVFIAHGIRVGVVGAPHIEVLGKDDAFYSLSKWPQQPLFQIGIRL